jgi:hypothetical protein
MLSCRQCRGWIEKFRDRVGKLQEKVVEQYNLNALIMFRDDNIPRNINKIFEETQDALYHAEVTDRQLYESNNSMEHEFENNLSEDEKPGATGTAKETEALDLGGSSSDSNSDDAMANESEDIVIPEANAEAVLWKAEQQMYGRKLFTERMELDKATFGDPLNEMEEDSVRDDVSVVNERTSKARTQTESPSSLERGCDNCNKQACALFKLSGLYVCKQCRDSSTETKPPRKSDMEDFTDQLTFGSEVDMTPASAVGSKQLFNSEGSGNIIDGTNLTKTLESIREGEETKVDTEEEDSIASRQKDAQLLSKSKVTGQPKAEGHDKSLSPGSTTSSGPSDDDGSHSEHSAAKAYEKSKATTLRPIPEARTTRSKANKEKESLRKSPARKQKLGVSESKTKLRSSPRRTPAKR